LSYFGELWKRLSPASSASSEASASPIYVSILHGYRGIQPQSSIAHVKGQKVHCACPYVSRDL